MVAGGLRVRRLRSRDARPSTAAGRRRSMPGGARRPRRLGRPGRGRSVRRTRARTSPCTPRRWPAARPARRRARCAGGRRRRGRRSGEKITGASATSQRVRASCPAETWERSTSMPSRFISRTTSSPNAVSPPRAGSSVAESAHGHVVVVGQRHVAHAERVAAPAGPPASSRSSARPPRPSARRSGRPRMAASTSSAVVARARSSGYRGHQPVDEVDLLQGRR